MILKQMCSKERDTQHQGRGSASARRHAVYDSKGLGIDLNPKQGTVSVSARQHPV